MVVGLPEVADDLLGHDRQFRCAHRGDEVTPLLQIVPFAAVHVPSGDICHVFRVILLRTFILHQPTQRPRSVPNPVFGCFSTAFVHTQVQGDARAIP